MLTQAVRLYGKNDLRLETFELPPIADDEILAKVVSDSICMSSHKAAMQGAAHKRVPHNVAEHPVIIGHEFSGELIEVGAKWRGQFSAGQKFTIQPALNYKGSLDSPGYSYSCLGGDATYVIIPNEVMELNCLLAYDGDAFFYGSLTEPMSCVVGAFHASYHTTCGSYIHDMGIKPGGNLALLAGAGPMGLGAIDYALHCDRRPGLLVVTDIDEDRLARAERMFPVERAAANGVRLVYANTSDHTRLLSLIDESSHPADGGFPAGYDDVFVFVPVASVVELGDRLLARDGCLNYFAGPTDPTFSARFNFYNAHYLSTHITGTSGGNTDDMRESIQMMNQGLIEPAVMVTHIGGLDCVARTTLDLPSIPGGKKLIYTHLSMPLTALSDLPALGQTDPFLAGLAEIVGANDGLWCPEAERYLLKTR